MTQPDRCIALQGATNFRDLGGYVGLDGRHLRWRRLFRSDHLGALTPGDVDALQGLRVSRVLDLRGAQERLATPSRLNGAEVHPLSIEPTVVQRLSVLLQAGQRPDEAMASGLMQDTYRRFVRHHADQFAQLFGHLLAAPDPLVFHCTAGKDRTGFAAALVLHSLGVSRQTVMEDYLLTNQYLKPVASAGSLPPELSAVLFRVKDSFLEAAIEAAEQDWGSIDNYLFKALRIGPDQRERLADLYLE